MTFVVGDRVHVAALGTGVVRQVRNGGRYLVEIKDRAVLVDGEGLVRAPEVRTSRRAKSSTAAASEPDAGPVGPPPSIDLHGLAIEDALDEVSAFLSRALLAGGSEVRIIHGRGAGRLKAAVHARLTLTSAVSRFRLDPRNPGVTIVIL